MARKLKASKYEIMEQRTRMWQIRSENKRLKVLNKGLERRHFIQQRELNIKEHEIKHLESNLKALKVFVHFLLSLTCTLIIILFIYN